MRRSRDATAALLAVAAIAALGLAPGARARGGAVQSTAATARPVAVTVDDRRAGPVIASDFLGLSFEARNLPQIARLATRGNLVALLSSLGPGVLRFGGVSVDTQAVWSAGRARLPRWATTPISAHDLAGIAQLTQRTGWRVLLGVNLGHYDAAAAAQEARAAQSAIGASLAGIEFGNEPDHYVSKLLRREPWGLAQYEPQVKRYRARLRAVAPGVAVAGPDAASGTSLSWLRAAAVAERPALLTAHYYPLGRCGHFVPVLGDLLSRGIRAAETHALAAIARAARAARIPLRVGETNNIACGGQPRVSNTFAAALWALDYLTRAMGAGVAGINFHDTIDNPRGYAPLAARTPTALAAGSLTAKPEFYALLAARGLLGDRPLRTAVSAGPANVTARAFASPQGRLDVVLVDFDRPGARPLLVRLRVAPRFANGTILRLSARSPAATTGVTLGGRSAAGGPQPQPQFALPGVSGRPGALSLTLAPSSAALVSLTQTPGPQASLSHAGWAGSLASRQPAAWSASVALYLAGVAISAWS